ncbi:protein kinase [Cylindrospermopsis raciborskii Cr2010]|nr:DUF697 domain-containing protein [Cylindrospermopsis raciborskii GIHE 2018]UJL34801.1 protein kinase [Cylindrospermopsis raciborskii Cr2010]
MNTICCLNPHCLNYNPDNCKYCQKCGSKLILRERFIPRKILGQGGFGRTFLATDTGKPSQPLCVIKQFLPQAQGTDTIDKASRLFNQEARQLEELGQHPQIPELFDYFTHPEDNRQYLVQEYIEGDTLEVELQKKGVFSTTQIRELLIELLNILAFVHEKQVIHRDIKPENIIRRAMDSKLFLVDFGAAKVVDGQAEMKEGTVIGSMEYCAPEQIRGQATFSSDIYSLGVTCMYLVTNVDPTSFYDTTTEKFLWRNHLGTNSVTDQLGRILDKMTASVRERYQSVGEVIKELNFAESNQSETKSDVNPVNYWQTLVSRAVEKGKQSVQQWFSINDSQVAEILATVTSQLPTTEALLLGKPQTGKSSIVRGFTGVSPEIIGQGFRPHTQNTERYIYPNNDLPLIIFTDTVGLGDTDKDTEVIIQEIIKDLNTGTKRARVFILTVKINDFATDTLRNIAQKLRQQYTHIPCLLAVTCLHEIYPPDMKNHPDYPPNFAEINRAFDEIKANFSGLYDRATLVDFTLEEDGYSPVFYGLEAFRDSLTSLLPEAEAKTIYQLLDEQAGDKLGNIYRDTARRYILPFSIMATTLAAVPLPFTTMPVLTALQVSMVGLLGKLYGQTLTPSQAGGIVSTITGGFLAQAIGRELIKFIPGFGTVIAASWAGAYTWSLGEAACVYFGDLMGGKKPDLQTIQNVMEQTFQSKENTQKEE